MHVDTCIKDLPKKYNNTRPVYYMYNCEQQKVWLLLIKWFDRLRRVQDAKIRKHLDVPLRAHFLFLQRTIICEMFVFYVSKLKVVVIY
jgi:hypothetical protein